MTRVIAIANEKGGVAKTTTAISLGGVLAEAGESVLLMDMDPQASLSVYFGRDKKPGAVTTADVLINSSTPTNLETGFPNLSVISTNKDLSLAERFLSVRNEPKLILKKVTKQIHSFDTIILDCPPSLGIITQNALVASDLLIVPVIPEYLAVNALRNIFLLIRSIRKSDNPYLSYRILFTLVDLRIKSHSNVSERFREKFRTSVFETEIHVDTRLRDASIAGIPITTFSQNTRSASEYKALAKEIYQHHQIGVDYRAVDPDKPQGDLRTNESLSN